MPSLEDQLSLARNGGVYYEGTRVTPTHDPILFVGLGGTGADALLRVKNEVQTRMPLPKDPVSGRVVGTSPGNIAFMAVDTDQAVLQKSYGVACFDEHGDELVEICVPGMASVVTEVVTNRLDQPQWRWYDRDITPGSGLNGAGGIRQLGRFMLFHNVEAVRQKFHAAITRVMRASNADTKRLKIFILTGIGGGTGSGTFLDMAYILREVANTLCQNVQIMGYIFTPDLNMQNGGNDVSMKRNGYAALKELDYWMSCGEHGAKFEQVYSSSYTVRAVETPFNFCHIITAQDASNNLITYKEAMDAVAGQLFAYIVDDISVDNSGNTALSSMYDNIAEHIDSSSKPYAANYNYLSVGSQKLEIPYTEITTMLGARVFSKLEPMFNQAPNQKTFEFDIMRLGLTERALWDYIHEGAPVGPLVNKSFGYGDIWPNQAPYAACRQWLAAVEPGVLTKQGGNLSGAKEGKFKEYLRALMASYEHGPCYAARLIRSNSNFCLVAHLSSLRDYFASLEEQCLQAYNRKADELNVIYAEGANVSVLRRKEYRNKYMETLNEWFNQHYNWFAYRELKNGLDTFIDRIQKYYNRLFKNLLDSLCVLPGIFRNNLAHISAREQDAMQHPEKYAHYLIRPAEFERMYKHQIENKVEEAYKTFLRELCENIERWVGIKLDDIDAQVLNQTDIGGAIAEFLNEQFSATLAMNIESILLPRMPVGGDQRSYFRTILQGLHSKSVPMFQLGAGLAAGVSTQDFSLASVPNDCSDMYLMAQDMRNNQIVPNLIAKPSTERSKIQWVKVMAGMPLYTFAAVADMERVYETAMQGGIAGRRGVHLSADWYEKLPSPLPEKVWEAGSATRPEKARVKAYNDRIRAAFKKCVAGGAITLNEAGNAAIFRIADASLLDGYVTYGDIAEQKKQVLALKKSLWETAKESITLNPMGTVIEDRMENICENTLRFYDICVKIVGQAAILDRLDGMLGKYESAERFAQAYACDLIRPAGVKVMFFRAKLDPMPLELYNKMTNATYPEYEAYQAFCAHIVREPQILDNIEKQYQQVISDTDALKPMLDRCVVTKEKWQTEQERCRKEIQDSKDEDVASKKATAEFYEKAMAFLDNYMHTITKALS